MASARLGVALSVVLLGATGCDKIHKMVHKDKGGASDAGVAAAVVPPDTRPTPPPVTAPAIPPTQAAQPEIPDVLKPPEKQVVALTAVGKGQQVYVCKASASDPKTFAWELKEPAAVLQDANGATIGKHYRGPTWESKDGSKVVGAMKQSAPAPGERSIPWLLVEAKSTAGKGVFTHVTFVQRVATKGGLSPDDPCDADHAERLAPVDYEATYVFYTAAP